ncbi:sodium/proline symporter PutP [Catenovulum maritimum]|uniref:Sodium/proline symporter n=1 Tax=Catenovulum maritimum TaxID=1513271 RepID=A0A0J8GTA2_9ALTE|nr:sodium/proline symporter PutP [Catenovulum maritimum]KMT64509.1 proline:sodium symporter PutP [Catenovulum maritimum]
MHYYSYISLFLYFAVMLAIGLFAYRKSTANVSDYLLGGRKVSPQVTALSAGASDMSGWMLMGLPGAMFTVGLDIIWVAFGLLVGAFLNYLYVAPKLRGFTEFFDDALTIPDFFAKRFNKPDSSIRLISATVIIIFFTLYTSSGLVAGGKLFESSFGLDYQLGLLVTASIVVAYTVLGGFLAVSLTDFVQGCIMFVALVLVPVVAFFNFDSLADLNQAGFSTIAGFDQFIANATILGVISSMAWGLGYFGQPHIIVRFMAVRSVSDIKTTRRIGMSWMSVTLIGALATGFTGVAYINKFNVSLTDPETIFIYFSQVLFHPLISGFLLAAILAAIMSTISSQLLVSSSSLTEDALKRFSKKEFTQSQLVVYGRVCVALVALVAAGLAWDASNSILSLVSNAWAGFGAAFGPLVLFSLYWKSLTHRAAIAGMLSGAATVLIWIYLPVLENEQTLSSVMYEIVPGFIVSSLTIVLVSLFDSKQTENYRALYQSAEQKMQETY